MVGTLGIGGLLVLGHHLAYEPPPVLPRLCLLVALLAAWVERAKPVRNRSQLIRVSTVGVCVAVPLVTAVWLVQDEFFDD